MLFDLVSDTKFIDVVDENGKLFKRFRTEAEYAEWASRFSPEDLKGLSRKDTVQKWYDSNFEVGKLVLAIMAVGYIVYSLIVG